MCSNKSHWIKALLSNGWMRFKMRQSQSFDLWWLSHSAISLKGPKRKFWLMKQVCVTVITLGKKVKQSFVDFGPLITRP